MSDRARGPSVRRLTSLALVGFLVVAVLVATELVWTSVLLERSLVTAVRDAESRAIAHELELSLLGYQRLRNLYALSGQEELARESDALIGRMDELVARAVQNTGYPEEALLLQEVEVGLDRYLAVRRTLERDHLDEDEVVRRSQPPLDRVLATLSELRDLNDTQVREAHAQVLWLDNVSSGAGLLAMALTAVGLGVLAFALRTFVLAPILALHEALLGVQDGRGEVRVPVGGALELAELAGCFNDMVESLARQREAQLAFIAGIAHDLRNPLSGLKLGIYALEREQSEDGRHRARQALDRQIQRLGRMVDDLLDAARIEAGNLELRVEPTDLREVVRDVVRLYTPTTEIHEIQVEMPEEPVVAPVDPARIEQVLGNLVSNAIKFSPAGGPVSVGLGLDGGLAALSVRDRGVGIAPDELKNIFLPFRRPRPDLAPGTGLGLSVVRRIVEAHGGHIDVDSEPGRGTTFRVTLPSAEFALP